MTSLRQFEAGYCPPRVSGAHGGALMPSYSPNGWRTRKRDSAKAFKRTCAKTAGGKARPFTGRQRDFNADADVSANNAYVRDAEIRANPLPKSKTAKQDMLYALCVAWIAGASADRQTWAGIQHGIDVIAASDPAHASAWRTAMAPYSVA